MTCWGCAAPPTSGKVNAECRACLIRDLAQGPLFWGSMQAGLLSPAYREALRKIGNEVEVHSEVKAKARELMRNKVAPP